MFTPLKIINEAPHNSPILQDVLCEILHRFLGLRDSSVVNLVCKSWYLVNHRQDVWEKRFKYHYPDLHAKYTTPNYLKLISPINWSEFYIQAYLQTCADLPRETIRDYHSIRRCIPAEIEVLLAQPDWKKRLFFYDMQGMSIWDFLYRLGDDERRQTILDLIFNKLSVDCKREDNTWDFERLLTYNIRRQLCMNVPKKIFPNIQNKLIIYALICNQAVLITTWLQLRNVQLDVSDITSLCSFAIRMGHQELLNIFFSQLDQRQTPSLWFYWSNEEPENIPPKTFYESRQSFYDYVFTWFNKNRSRFSSFFDINQVALEFNQTTFIRKLSKKTFDFNPLNFACSNEMVKVLAPSLPLYDLPHSMSPCLDNLELLDAIYAHVSYNWIEICGLTIELGSLHSFIYLLQKIPITSYALFEKILLSPNPTLLLHFFKVFPTALELTHIKHCINDKEYETENHFGRFSFRVLKWLPELGIDTRWYLKKYGCALFYKEMFNRFPRAEVIRHLLGNFNVSIHGDMIIRQIQTNLEKLTQQFHKYPQDVESYAEIIEVVGEFLAFGVDVEKNGGYQMSILGELERLKGVNSDVAECLAIKIPIKTTRGCTIL